MKTVLAVAAALAGVCGIASGQPEDERRAMLEQRRALLEARIAEIDAELSGESPPGTVQIVSPGMGFERGIRPADRMGDRAGRGMKQPEPELDSRSRDELLDRLAESDPELADRIRGIVSDRPGMPAPVLGRLRELVHVQTYDPDLYALRKTEVLTGIDVFQAAGVVRDLLRTSADPDEIRSAEQTLREAVERGFDAKAAILLHEIERTESHLGGMRRKSQLAQENRESVLEEQFQRLLRRVHRAAEEGARRGE